MEYVAQQPLFNIAPGPQSPAYCTASPSGIFPSFPLRVYLFTSLPCLASTLGMVFLVLLICNSANVLQKHLSSTFPKSESNKTFQDVLALL